jgi:hypothetical protein
MMKTITLAVTAMLSLAVLTMTAMSQSQTGDTAYEKKSYNYAEWAKGRFRSRHGKKRRKDYLSGRRRSGR